MDKNQIFGVDDNGDPFKGGGDGGAAGDVTHSAVLRELQVENLTSYCGRQIIQAAFDQIYMLMNASPKFSSYI